MQVGAALIKSTLEVCATVGPFLPCSVCCNFIRCGGKCLNSWGKVSLALYTVKIQSQPRLESSHDGFTLLMAVLTLKKVN